jgi:hypothetical protein
MRDREGAGKRAATATGGGIGVAIAIAVAMVGGGVVRALVPRISRNRYMRKHESRRRLQPRKWRGGRSQRRIGRGRGT